MYGARTHGRTRVSGRGGRGRAGRGGAKPTYSNSRPCPPASEQRALVSLLCRHFLLSNDKHWTRDGVSRESKQRLKEGRRLAGGGGEGMGQYEQRRPQPDCPCPGPTAPRTASKSRLPRDGVKRIGIGAQRPNPDALTHPAHPYIACTLYCNRAQAWRGVAWRGRTASRAVL